MRELRWAGYSILLGLLLGFTCFAARAQRVFADEPTTSVIVTAVQDPAIGQVDAVPDDTGAVLVDSGACVNGSVPGPNGCTSTYASSTYYNYPQSPYYYYPYNAYNYAQVYNYCYAYYPTCQYYKTAQYYPNYYYYPSASYSGSYYWCTIPGGGQVWVAQGQSTSGMNCT